MPDYFVATAAEAKQIRDLQEFQKKQIPNRRPGDLPQSPIPPSGTMFAKTTTIGVPPRSMDTLGHALCALYILDFVSGISNPTAKKLRAVLNPDGSAVERQIYNVGRTPVPANTYIQIKQAQTGEWICERAKLSPTDGGYLLCDCTVCVGCTEISSCDGMGGVASYDWYFPIGVWFAYPEISGNQYLHSIGSCQWESDEIIVAGFEPVLLACEGTTSTTTSTEPPTLSGHYKWVLDASSAPATLSLIHVSGDDPMGLLGAYTVQYIGTLNGACRSRMTAVNPHLFPMPDGVNCAVCITPLGGISTTTTIAPTTTSAP